MSIGKLIEELYSYREDIDATQIAEILWLQKTIGFKNKHTSPDIANPVEKPLPKDEKSQESIKLPRDVLHTVVINSAKKRNEKSTQHGLEKNQNSNSFYGVKFRYKEKFPDIVKQFQLLKLKQNSLDKNVLDEKKSADYMATTGLFHPIFRKEKTRRSYLNLNLVIDINDSMFLWEESIKHFKKSLQKANVFEKISIFELESQHKEVVLRHGVSRKSIKPNAHVFKEQKTLTLVVSDVVGNVWHSGTMFNLLDLWSKHSFVAIVSMLPKNMWERTPLRDGVTLFSQSRKFLPKNSDLRAKYVFVERTLEKHNNKIPIIPYDDTAFKYLTHTLTAKKGNWIDTRVFKKETIFEVEERLNNKVEAKERVERFLSTVPIEARKVAIYCSVLPLHRKIIEELIREKSLGKEMDAFAEFYFGGLLKRKENTKDEFLFYDGVRRELLAYISMKEIESVYRLLSSVISESLGLNYSILELLYESDELSETLSDKEKELMQILIEVLEEKGDFYQTKNIVSMNEKINSVFLETNSYQMGSEDGNYNEKPVHTIIFDYDFAIAKAPVTFEEYDLYCEDIEYLKKYKLDIKKPNAEGWGRGKRPVINVSWEDAQNYCNWLNDKLDIKKDSLYRYRLPTEAEWEYSCRAGTTTQWSFGNDKSMLQEYAWYIKNSNRQIHEVSTKKPNSWGLYDMHGNIWEWCEDDWIDNYSKTPKNGIACKFKKLKSKQNNKVVRGGSAIFHANKTKSSYRYVRHFTKKYSSFGFRLLRTLP